MSVPGHPLTFQEVTGPGPDSPGLPKEQPLGMGTDGEPWRTGRQEEDPCSSPKDQMFLGWVDRGLELSCPPSHNAWSHRQKLPEAVPGSWLSGAVPLGMQGLKHCGRIFPRPFWPALTAWPHPHGPGPGVSLRG